MLLLLNSALPGPLLSPPQSRVPLRRTSMIPLFVLKPSVLSNLLLSLRVPFQTVAWHGLTFSASSTPFHALPQTTPTQRPTHLRRFTTRLKQRLASARDDSPLTQRAQHFQSEAVLSAHLAQYEDDLRSRKATLLNRIVRFDADECDYTTRILTARHVSDADRSATALIDPADGSVAHATTGMLSASRRFYEQLLGVQPSPAEAPEPSSFLPSLPVLDAAQQQSLFVPASLKEARATIGALKSRKAPGVDGIPNDLFKAFADLLAPHLLPVLQAFLTDPWLPPEVQGAIICPLYKGAGDRRDLSNVQIFATLPPAVSISW